MTYIDHGLDPLRRPSPYEHDETSPPNQATVARYLARFVVTNGSANRSAPTTMIDLTIEEPAEHGRGLERSVEEP